MSLICSQNFTIASAIPPTVLNAYWNFDEAAAQWVDEVGSYTMPWYQDLDEILIGTVGGKISNCAVVGWDVSSKPNYPLGANGPSYVNTGAGASIWFWVAYHDSGFVPIFGNASVTMIFNPFSFLIEKIIAGNNLKFSAIIGGATATSTISLVSDSWHFVCATYDRVNTKLSLYIDNAASVDAVTISTPASVSKTLPRISSLLTTDFITSDSMLLDEMGASMSGPITSTQVSSLYNAGSGVTWPAVNAIVPLT